MEVAEIEKIIQTAGANGDTDLFLRGRNISSLPESIGSLTNLTHLFASNNELTCLPESIGNLTNLTHLFLDNNKLQALPSSIYDLTNLRYLILSNNQIFFLSSKIEKLVNLEHLDLSLNKIEYIPKSIGYVSSLKTLRLQQNRIIDLPQSLQRLNYLRYLSLHNNPLEDLSVLSKLPRLSKVGFFNFEPLPHIYWAKFSDFQAEWLFLKEPNSQIRRTIIEQLGYKKICDRLGAIEIDTWREYTLLKIEGAGESRSYSRKPDPLILLKMICPSTQQIYILRVPPDMTSAEAAITWINHGIHPDEFSIQT